jgi:uncharacterized protein YdhG (YjbR/CyaY superfamily)
MKAERPAPQSVDDYIAGFPPEVQAVLQRVRSDQEGRTERHRENQLQIPDFRLARQLVHFAAWSSHIGFYPGASGVKKFQKELVAYESAKGSVQFPLEKRMPLGLIAKIVKFRVTENLAKRATRKDKQPRRR